MVLVAAEVCDERKATDLRILELDPVDSGFTDFFLIASGSNTRQTGAIADEIELRLKRLFGTYAKSVEGRRTGEWILLDYVDFVVHIFTEQTREFYDIERLRKSARPRDAHELAAELNRKPEPAAGKRAAKRAAPGTAPSPALQKAGKKTAAKKAALKKTAVKKTTKSPAKKAIKKAPRSRAQQPPSAGE